jgi:RNA polymerase sigma-70 factor (ECF subfamily)
VAAANKGWDTLKSRTMHNEKTSVNDLARACAYSADAAEWQELVRRCMPLVSMVALRVSRMWVTSPSPAVVDDIVQEVFLKLCEQERRILRTFEPRGEDSFFGLLRIVTGSVTNDYFRRHNSAKRGGKVVSMPLLEDQAQGNAEFAGSTERVQHSALLAQLDRKLRSAPQSISERDRALFWLYYLQGYTAEEIAHVSQVGLSAKGVESALRRVTAWLRSEVARENAPAQAEAG